MSGLSRTPGKRVWVNSPPRVRIPPAPPKNQKSLHMCRLFLFGDPEGDGMRPLKTAPVQQGLSDQRTTAICERSPPL